MSTETKMVLKTAIYIFAEKTQIWGYCSEKKIEKKTQTRQFTYFPNAQLSVVMLSRIVMLILNNFWNEAKRALKS